MVNNFQSNSLYFWSNFVAHLFSVLRLAEFNGQLVCKVPKLGFGTFYNRRCHNLNFVFGKVQDKLTDSVEKLGSIDMLFNFEELFCKNIGVIN